MTGRSEEGLSMPRTHVKGSWAAAVIGILTAVLGVALSLIAIWLAIADWRGLLLLLPALGLIKLGGMIYQGRLYVPLRRREREPVEIKSPQVQDFAHHNRAWDNVSRWERKYGRGRYKGEEREGKPQKNLEIWESRLKR